jgi:VTC domain-containing protein
MTLREKPRERGYRMHAVVLTEKSPVFPRFFFQFRLQLRIYVLSQPSQFGAVSMQEAYARAVAVEAACSPGLRSDRDLGPAFELKYHLPAAQALDVECWARQALTPDPHGIDGTYRVTSVYCDTAHFDVFHRSAGFRRNKYRLRRYGQAPMVYLERKSRTGDQVRKRRLEVLEEDLGLLACSGPLPNWAGIWFHERIHRLNLHPTCRVAYDRTAFFGMSGDMPVRLTIDRELIGVPADDWSVVPLDDGPPLIPGDALVELKFHVHLPKLFHELLSHLPAQPARVSKYRRCVELSGLQRAPG